MNALRFHWSTYIVAGFATLLVAVGFFAEVFQAPPIPQEIAQLIKNPLPIERIKKLKRVSFSNKMGQFKFENSHPEGLMEGPWQMIEPTNIRARKDFFIKMIGVLEEIQIRHTHRSETINLQSFSLDKPLFTLELEPIKGSKLEIAFGLINPIDNSTYFAIKGEEWIYQCNTLSIPFETVTPDELLDSKALALNFDQINFVELATYPFQGPAVKLTRAELEWQDETGRKFDRRKVESFLKDLQNIKSYMVLDKLTPVQSQELQRLLSTPAHRLRMVSGNAVPETFYISSPLEALVDLRFEKKRSVLFYREGSVNPLVLSGEEANVFYRKEKDFR